MMGIMFAAVLFNYCALRKWKKNPAASKREIGLLYRLESRQAGESPAAVPSRSDEDEEIPATACPVELREAVP